MGYTIKPEVSLPITPTVGSVAYRSVGQDQDGSIVASGSQLYLAVTAPPADVNTSYSFFGQIVEGQDILPSLTVSDTIESVTVEDEVGCRFESKKARTGLPGRAFFVWRRTGC